MKTPASRAFGKRGALILIAALVIILLAASTSHLFLLRSGSETETKAALATKALQLFGVPPSVIVYGDKVAADYLIEIVNAIAGRETLFASVMYSETEKRIAVKVGDADKFKAAAPVIHKALEAQIR